MKKFAIALGALWTLASFSANAHYMGDHPVGDTICRFFGTVQPTTGASFALASGTVEIYKDASDTEDTDDSGVTLTASVDSVAGQNRICIDTSADGTFYSAGSFFSVNLEAGTVDGVSVVGQPILSFSLANEASFARLGAPAGASIAADIVTLDNFIDTEIGTLQTSITAVDDFVDTEITTIDDLLDTEIADIRRAQGPATTTIASLASQTSFTLTAGLADDNAYNGFGLYAVDASTAVQVELGTVCDYTGSSKTVTLCADPGVFTIATTDNVILMPAFLTTGVDVLTIESVDATDQLDAHAAAGLDAAGVRSAVGLSSANLDTQLTAIDDAVDTEVAAILVDTGTTLDDFLDTEVAAILSDTNAILVDTSTTLDDFLDTEVSAILTAVDTEVAAILADTDEVQTTLAAGGTIESLVDDLPAITTAVGTTIPAAVTVIDDFLDTEVTALMNARTQLFPAGVDADSVLTADSGDTNTLVDTELTFSAAQDIDGAYVVRVDGQRCFVDSFVPATDVIEFGACTFTGAWSTQTYKIYPAGTQ